MIEKSVFEFNKFRTIQTYMAHSPAIIDETVFSFIDRYLHGNTSGTEDDLVMLQEFGTQITNYYNEKLLGVKY